MRKVKDFFIMLLCKIVRGFLISGMYILFRPKIIYEDKKADKLSRKQANIIIANHKTLFDGIFLATVMHHHKNIYILVTNKWYSKPFYKTILAGNRCIPVDLTTMDTAWMHESMKAVRGGSSICIFPEGHRAKGDTMDEFKPGFTLLAQMTGVPIIPVCLDGPYKYIFGARKRAYIGVAQTMTPNDGSMSAEYLTNEAARFRELLLNMQLSYGSKYAK